MRVAQTTGANVGEKRAGDGEAEGVASVRSETATEKQDEGRHREAGRRCKSRRGKYLEKQGAAADYVLCSSGSCAGRRAV